MEIRNFNELIKMVQRFDSKKKVAIVSAQDKHTLEAVFKAKKDNIIEPILIGDREKIIEILKDINESLDDLIIDVKSDVEAANKAVELINNKKADFIMKGKIQTADLLKAVVNKEHGLRTGKIMSHVVIHEIPNYYKLLAVSDGGMMMYPTLEEKKAIIENAVDVFLNLGYECPKVAVLAAVENVNPKMPEAVDAYELKNMNKMNIIKNCIVEGPISYDLTMSKESAEIKEYVSPVTGEADILIVPNITTGNILGKSLVYSSGAKMAGFVVGAKAPIVLTSRGSTAEEKYLSLVLSASVVK
ncbi:bifunctional enoyl-CoA hydratase/phosphate acetyltransferase [uncultured Clostridium sp.]|uniref:bifunctional enoyl-CoA hydratase/phosphate acetyltransferase n=1 Tax=uncultured Clostridium sp. TaxID=59620 RepID=UPI00258E91F0|nr:bifunctional enoyl-CoA hydratase/phosphate acetyltransferase [uncultured Clostridium sp.]